MCYPDGGQATGGKDYQHSPDTYDLSSLWPLWSIKLGKNKGHFRFWQQQDVKGRSALETSWKVPPVLRSQTPKNLWISGTATQILILLERLCLGRTCLLYADCMAKSIWTPLVTYVIIQLICSRAQSQLHKQMTLPVWTGLNGNKYLQQVQHLVEERLKPAAV